MVTNRIIFFATSVQPNPEEIDYWVDLSDNPYGGSIKYFNGTEWVRLAASGGTPDLSNYYTKTQINNLLNNKADVGDVDSKVDDGEVKDVIKDIQFNTSNPNGITMVMFKYDGSNKTVSIPVASTSSAGIITSKDFLDFVKQHQLQELHTEMIDTFADIRAKYQKKLIAGLNIEIDQETNVISASGDLAVQWDNITNKPDFKPVATSGDYNDLINKLKPGKDVSISEDNTISIAIDSDSLEQSLATLQSNIDKEAATARAAETKLGNDIATEKNRAQSAEQTISTNLQNEINRATGVESTLSSDVELISKTKVDKVTGKQLSTEDYTTEEKTKLSSIDNNANNYTLPAATTTTLGGIIVGDRLSVDSTGKLVATYTYTLPTASSSVLGGVKTGSNITNTDGTISLTKANVTSALGVDPTTTYVKKAGDTMTGALTNSSTISGSKLISTVATGTAPIQVSSTTLCTNLNADMVDGYHSEHFSQNKSNKSLQTSSDKDTYFKIIELTRNTATTDSIYIKYGITVRAVSAIDYSNTTLYGDIEIFGSFSPTVVNYKVRCSSDFINKGRLRAYVNGDNLQIWYVGYIWENVATYKRIERNINHFTVNYNIELTSTLPNIDTIPIEGTQPEDWYGVSWSETSSNPDCTRIGNMDMHRSLPIQSMMKGYLYFKDGNPLYRMLKLNDSWTKCENYSAGGWRDVDTLLEDNNINVMIKIPEFWWIDDYTESTETHNLKICPHAKPGWYHHKEAYVSAYEGYIDGNYYRSSKNKIPSVNFTRSAVRPKARANGLGNSWNIYTYNEHRAICHLFLVEYATRNSQKAVNTALTVEGFRQGGLGSGCTTDTVTINGATTYSFIPTGSSDSLGSGSGEVTVTIQQTDSSGSNTTTTTRKCNRYRGIENPFGHVWKHTDDVVSVYISGYDARFWYKCDSPDHFGDSISNDNPYYKNIAANAVVAGYKTKIVTTSTCDFFALSCNNGSKTTYWCDYNWDNTDGSLHCLLIGGGSDDGGLAGLFALHSHHGVGRSSAHIGSRLTYLPWAE